MFDFDPFEMPGERPRCRRCRRDMTAEAARAWATADFAPDWTCPGCFTPAERRAVADELRRQAERETSLADQHRERGRQLERLADEAEQGAARAEEALEVEL